MIKKIFLGLILSWGLVGCTAPVNPDITPTPTSTPQPAIIVVFDNQADIPVDPHFYHSTATLTADGLFADPANRFQNFNSKTTIPAKTSLSVPFLLTQSATIGSQEATFADLTTFTSGKASESPVLHSGTDFTTGQTVTFTFSRDSSGNYHTTAAVKK